MGPISLVRGPRRDWALSHLCGLARQVRLAIRKEQPVSKVMIMAGGVAQNPRTTSTGKSVLRVTFDHILRKRNPLIRQGRADLPKVLISARRKVSAVSAGDGSPVYGTLEIIEGGFCTSPSRRSGTFLQAALLKMLDCLNMDPMMLRPLEYRKGGSRKARVAERANRDAD